ncbi:hypothetical protein RA27_22155 [Ruegeria sp. ANG-R]|uniref:hypothetical protein n=1 Tax=Ruegeria sp. ANG-R TaxID=1577903 RepID=UPI00057C5274|nr:hypothetical protein [Ruegeria sp. ANG-R]KIC36460.1 hypothetical protein RA27_22155 [Ruegeria sp. ANG-R]
MNLSYFGIAVAILALPAFADECPNIEIGEERSLSDIPKQWPEDVPRPTELKNIGGLLSKNERSCTVDLYGRIADPGEQFLMQYETELVSAGFELQDQYQIGDRLTLRFEREDLNLVVGSSVVNARTDNEYTELGLVLTIPN